MKEERYLDERLLYISDYDSLSYKKGKLIYRKNDSGLIQKCEIGNNTNHIKLVERLMRKEPRCATRVDLSHFIVSFNGTIINYNCLNNTATTEHNFDRGMKNPLTFLSIHNGVKECDVILYGEYIWNENKGPVAIYKREDNCWRKAYEFPKETILHIHNIINDPYRNGLIVLSGDSDNESGIWFADYEFNTVKPIVIGNQQYRACVAFPTETGIIYATDTPLERNHIHFIKLSEECEMVTFETEQEIPGPCIYGIEHDENYYFSTSVEPDSSLPSWRYRLTYRLGPGVADRYTHIIKRDKEGKYEEYYAVKKDILPMWLFQFGNVQFPENETKELYAVLQGTKKGHGITVRL